MLHAIASALTPIVFVIGLGVIAAHFGIVTRDQSKIIAVFVVRFALPCALFLAAANTAGSDIENVGFLLSLAVGLCGTFIAGLVIGHVVFGRDWKASAMQALACSFPNAAYCGPPVLAAAVPSGSILSVVIANLVVSLVLVPAALILVHADDATSSSAVGLLATNLYRAAMQPLVWLPMLGVAIALTGLRLPPVAASAFDQIGRGAGGAALFTLGTILYGQRPRLDRETILNVSLKNVAQPVLIGATAVGLGLPSDLMKEAFLIGVLPAATVVPSLALKSGAYTDEAATSVLMSTIASIATISLGIVIAQFIR